MLVTTADMERRAAIYELLSRPDPPDLRRGHWVRYEGRPNRWEILPQLMMAFVQRRLMEARGEP